MPLADLTEGRSYEARTTGFVVKRLGWDDKSSYGAGEVGKSAFVVVTSSPPEPVRLTDLDWTFVSA